MVQRSIVQCRVVQCSVVQCSVVQCTVVQCTVVQYTVVQCSVVQCSVWIFCVRNSSIIISLFEGFEILLLGKLSKKKRKVFEFT